MTSDDISHQRAQDVLLLSVESARKNSQLEDCFTQIRSLEAQVGTLKQYPVDSLAHRQPLENSMLVARCRSLQLSNEQLVCEAATRRSQLMASLALESAHVAEVASLTERCHRLQQKVESSSTSDAYSSSTGRLSPMPSSANTGRSSPMPMAGGHGHLSPDSLTSPVPNSVPLHSIFSCPILSSSSF